MSLARRQIVHKPLHVDVYQTLKEAILTGELKPGEAIGEAELSRRWEVSRSPIREALRKLEHDGLVRWSSRRGATVAGITVAGVRDVYQVREVLEGLGARLVAERASAADLDRLDELSQGIGRAERSGDRLEAIRLDDALHRAMARLSGNRALESSWTRLLDRVLMARMMVRRDPGRVDQIMVEHEALLAALRERDGERAAELAAAHIRMARVRLMEMLQRSSVEEEGIPG
jgi:DNA-binding GntR family transcriptional regulator